MHCLYFSVNRFSVSKCRATRIWWRNNISVGLMMRNSCLDRLWSSGLRRSKRVSCGRRLWIVSPEWMKAAKAPTLGHKTGLGRWNAAAILKNLYYRRLFEGNQHEWKAIELAKPVGKTAFKPFGLALHHTPGTKRPANFQTHGLCRFLFFCPYFQRFSLSSLVCHPMPPRKTETSQGPMLQNKTSPRPYIKSIIRNFPIL